MGTRAPGAGCELAQFAGEERRTHAGPVLCVAVHERERITNTEEMIKARQRKSCCWLTESGVHITQAFTALHTGYTN